MKKIISLALCLFMFVSLCVSTGAVSFSDLSSDHWAYESIKTLVDEGTINGYSDGTFQPERTVTRAEFAKMIGKWNQKYEGTYADISENHWAYEYIMWSGLDAVNNRISPDVKIKRSDVINLIWKRNGSPKNDLAPGAIINQGTNDDATSWAYTIGLMKGDDGLNLRLNSSLTRAEAATLIIRSRELVKKDEKNNFIDVVGEEVLKQTFETLDLLEGVAYESDKVLTYGEVARMAMVFGADGNNINFVGADLVNSKSEHFRELGHKYDNEMFVLASKVWGDDYYTLKKIDTPITKQDAISAIMYGFTRRGTTPVTAGEKDIYYPDCKNANSTAWENIYLTFANKCGIKLYASDKLGAAETVTHKEYSAFLVLFNDAAGLGVAYTENGKTNAKINTAGSTTPANVLDFRYTIDGAPLGIYQLKNDNVSAEASYKQLNMLSSTYCGYLSQVVSLTSEKTGYKMSYTYFPSLSYKQDGKNIFTAKFTIDNVKENPSVSVDELFADVIKTPTGYTATQDNEIYVVFETYGPLMDVYLPYTDAAVKAVFVK
ncbi:MAG: S-layer homology domain-containing protein [Clostridia bacterium]|nr:S-layer homology domain-containing protein [Clostridia bacterium]